MAQDDCQRFPELQVSLSTPSREKESITGQYRLKIKRFSCIKPIEEYLFLLPPSNISEPVLLNKGIVYTERFNLNLELNWE